MVVGASGLSTAGLRVTFSPEGSWAAIRDKLAFSILDGVQVLAPMSSALAAVLGGMQAQVAFGLSRHRNDSAPSYELAGGGLAAKLKARPAPATLPVVFHLSSHNYLRRRWLLAQGVNSQCDVRLYEPEPVLETQS